MFFIGIARVDLAKLLSEGVAVRVNGQPTVIRREGDYLCYGANRCKILKAIQDGDFVCFFCACHGEEGEEHIIIA